MYWMSRSTRCDESELRALPDSYLICRWCDVSTAHMHREITDIVTKTFDVVVVEEFDVLLEVRDELEEGIVFIQ